MQHGRSLRRALGGRLRTYRPRRTGQTHLEAVRKSLVRGELVLNGFSRWRLLQARGPALCWTFAEAGQTAAIAQREIRVARRESGQLRIVEADEKTADEVIAQIETAYKRPELLIARRDWVERPALNPSFRRMLSVARKHCLVVHVIAALGTASRIDDEVQRTALQIHRFQQNPLLRPLPHTSNIERRFGNALARLRLDPKPQHPVAHYFLDFAVFGSVGALPVRLDVEVDGPYWHEELPGCHRVEDKHRDQILKKLGWRPIRFWTNEIEQDEIKCIEIIEKEAASAVPLAGRNS